MITAETSFDTFNDFLLGSLVVEQLGTVGMPSRTCRMPKYLSSVLPLTVHWLADQKVSLELEPMGAMSDESISEHKIKRIVTVGLCLVDFSVYKFLEVSASVAGQAFTYCTASLTLAVLRTCRY